MKQFLNGSHEAFCTLEEQAKGKCIRFRSQEMPPGCNPGRADIGFEVFESPLETMLYVEKGVQYSGRVEAVQTWLREGVMSFENFSALEQWMKGPLSQAYSGGASTSNSGQTANRERPVSITDMNAVHEGIRDLERPLYLDENDLFERLALRVLGQENALRNLSSLVARHLARSKPARPAVVFAVGPSGVGKTRTAEMLSKELRAIDNENHGYQYVRLDMTEYQEAHRVSQLIGAPQGYIGHGEGSQLTDALRANSRTIVLFDEIEKAHPAILRVLMNAMDAGRLATASRNSDGREIDCRHAVFMFTSNLDAKSILDELESRSAFGERTVEDEVCRRRLHAGGIAPEIVGRIGRFLVYRPLDAETRAEIVAMAIREVAEEYGLNVTYVEPEVIVEVMQKTRSHSFGVRPERFLIDDLLGGAFAEMAAQGVRESVKVAGPPFMCKVDASIDNCMSTANIDEASAQDVNSD